MVIRLLYPKTYNNANRLTLFDGPIYRSVTGIVYALLTKL